MLSHSLGIDFSTQQAKAVVLNEDSRILHQVFIVFDSEIPEFRTCNGVIVQQNGIVASSPTSMWLKAIDLLMDKLRIDGFQFSNLSSISGSAQQHGSVYWKSGAEEILGNLDPNNFLHLQLNSCFSISYSPIWMDSSTSVYCRRIEQIVGSPEKLCNITGSRAWERFTGNQIAKIITEKNDAYCNTERISLVSSFLCSLFLGKYAPIDYGDACGMNLFDIYNKKWSKICVNACDSQLPDKLGDAVASQTVLGNVSDYFVSRFDFNPECKVVAFTGDNLSSFAGMQLQSSDLAISLGTSDTLFTCVEKPLLCLEAHLFINPLDVENYLALVCFKNGSLAREKVRDKCAKSSWHSFNQLLEATPRGNDGNIGMFYFDREISPNVEGVFRYIKSASSEYEQVKKFSNDEIEVRAIVEGQCMAKRIYARKIGVEIDALNRIVATGGASENEKILQVLADVFNKPVYKLESHNSACLGAAYRAMFALSHKSFAETIRRNSFELVAKPNSDAQKVYEPLLIEYEKLLEHLKKT